MKTNENKQADSLYNALQEDKHQLLSHLLSPLEREAIKQKYSSFEYSVNNIKVHINAQTCKQLRELSVIKIALFSAILNENSISIVGEDAKIHMFLDTPIEHFHFPTRVYHVLRGMDCYTMREIIGHGRRNVSRFRGMGTVGMQILDELMKKHGCEFLFV